MIEIKHVNGTVLYTPQAAADIRQALEEAVKAGADLAGADLTPAYLSGAYLAGADLAGANLAGAYLAGAYLAGADLTGANLTRADLTRADLTGANLTDAKGVNPHRVNPLLILRDQPGQIRAYKLVTADGYGPFNGGVQFTVGETVEVGSANTDEHEQCAAGVNVATLPWCIHEWLTGYRILIVEFTAADIAAIPIGDGKFRLHRCSVVGEKDLAEIGLVS